MAPSAHDLVLANLATAQSGDYAVVVSNAAGRANSAATIQGVRFMSALRRIGRSYATLAGESFAASKRSLSQGGIWIGRKDFMSTTTATLRARKTGRAPTAPS